MQQFLVLLEQLQYNRCLNRLPGLTCSLVAVGGQLHFPRRRWSCQRATVKQSPLRTLFMVRTVCDSFSAPILSRFGVNLDLSARVCLVPLVGEYERKDMTGTTRYGTACTGGWTRVIKDHVYPLKMEPF